MKFRHFALPLASLLLCAATEPPPEPTSEPTSTPPPPAILEPYITDGAFDPGDFAYLKGSLITANAAEKAEYKAILEWSSACTRPAEDAIVHELARRGFTRDDASRFPAGPVLCIQPLVTPDLTDDLTFAQLTEELARVRPLYETWLMAVALAEDLPDIPPADFGRALEQRTRAEQMVRRGMGWGAGSMAHAPDVSPIGRAIIQARMGIEMMRLDRENTQWLKDRVAQHGWPRISVVGETAAHNAWLLAQHADADPVFQLDALQMMEPLVAQQEVSGRDYAYLYDRVMLALSGKQRYATQFECVDGAYAPQPVKDMAAVARYRAEAGLDTLAQNLQRMRDNYGTCD
ncbi:MAG: hypothetical protein DI637_12490 [Citromicrobium sp.]|nr:MAG: hypothetical protein DI637_12490 [Citromicrobium sp.]